MADSNRQRAPATGNESANSQVELNSIGGPRPQILIPTIAAKQLAFARPPKLVADPKRHCGLGAVNSYRQAYRRRPMEVSRVALDMLLAGHQSALNAYLRGDRSGPLVAPYFARAGLRPNG